MNKLPTNIEMFLPVKIKKLHKDAIIPTYGTDKSAAVDLYAIEDYTIKPNSGVVKVRTGLAVELPEGYCAKIYNRSGWASKQQLIIVSSRLIDEDYRGEIIVPMKLIADVPHMWARQVNKGDRIAQMMIEKYEKIMFEEVDELTNTERGAGGFGSTGK